MASQNHPEDIQDHDAADSPESLLIGGPVQELPKEAAAASPVSYVSAGVPPILLVHGDEDRVVPAGQTANCTSGWPRLAPRSNCASFPAPTIA